MPEEHSQFEILHWGKYVDSKYRAFDISSLYSEIKNLQEGILKTTRQQSALATVVEQMGSTSCDFA